MAVRPYWKGTLELSLVSCPVVLYPASSAAEETHFHLINRETGHRLQQQMVDSQTGDIVEKDQKGRGYELSKGKYVEIEPDQLEAVQLESTHTIDIDSFVPREEIDERYIDKPYYLAPDGKAGADAFAVIRDAMSRAERVALGRVVLSHREHIIAIRPLGKGLLATTLRYPYEVREEHDYFAKIPSPRVSREMVELGAHILKSKEARFDPEKFKDRYETALKALVRRKAAGKVIKEPEKDEREGNVIDLMDALKRSLGRKGGPGRKVHTRAGGARRKTAKSRTSRTRRKLRKAG